MLIEESKEEQSPSEIRTSSNPEVERPREPLESAIASPGSSRNNDPSPGGQP